jgi:hypothetical protein
MKTYSALTVCVLVAIAASGVWGLASIRAQEAAEKKEPSRMEIKERVIKRGGPATSSGAYGEAGEAYGRGGYGREGAGYGGGRGGMFSAKGGKFTVTMGGMGMGGAPESLHAIREAAAALSEAEDDEAKDEAQGRLAKLLDEYFEEDMKRRENELADVEKRVRQLRELLERRREKKEDIIELQVEVLRNEADGLGFFSAEGPQGAINILEHRLLNHAVMGMPAIAPHPVLSDPTSPAAAAVAPVPVK